MLINVAYNSIYEYEGTRYLRVRETNMTPLRQWNCHAPHSHNLSISVLTNHKPGPAIPLQPYGMGLMTEQFYEIPAWRRDWRAGDLMSSWSRVQCRYLCTKIDLTSLRRTASRVRCLLFQRLGMTIGERKVYKDGRYIPRKVHSEHTATQSSYPTSTFI
jgi:hypothetical protein